MSDIGFIVCEEIIKNNDNNNEYDNLKIKIGMEITGFNIEYEIEIIIFFDINFSYSKTLKGSEKLYHYCLHGSETDFLIMAHVLQYYQSFNKCFSVKFEEYYKSYLFDSIKDADGLIKKYLEEYLNIFFDRPNGISEKVLEKCKNFEYLEKYLY